MKTTCIRLSIDEKRYALALSKRVPGCPRPDAGSVAHGLKWALNEQAKKEGIRLK
jgi:hypothetical protein